MKVGVVIVSYNTAALLLTCLQSLQRCTLPLHIVVVDNASSDATQRLIPATFPDIHFHVREHNDGFAVATNHGLTKLGYGCAPATAAPPYTLLLNPDTIVHPGAIETLVSFLDAHPRVGLVAPRLLNLDGTVQAAAFRFPTLSMSLLDMFPPGEVLPGRLYHSWWNGRYPHEQDAISEPFPIDHPLGACMLVRRATIEEVGLLDESYALYSEEIDWCRRIHQAGWAIWQVPAARVTHVGGASTRQFRHRSLIALHESRIHFLRCHSTPMITRLHCLITIAGMLRLCAQAWRSWHRQQILADELRVRLWAYGQIVQRCRAALTA